MRILNAIMLAPFVASCMCLYMLARQLRLSPFACLITVALFAFSLPTIDAMAWQATSHDRLSLMFCLLALNAALFFQLRPPSLKTLVGSNLLVLVCLVGAYNSKLSAIFLAPSLLLLPFLLPGQKLKNRIVGLEMLAVPLAYAAYNNVRFFVMLQGDTVSAAHIVGGSLGIAGIAKRMCHLLGFLPVRDLAVILPMVLGALFLLLVISIRQATLSKDDTLTAFRLRTVLWLVSTFVMAFTVTLLTKHIAAYYQFIPRVFLVLCVAQVVVVLIECLNRHGNRRISAGLVLGLLFVGSLIPFMNEVVPEYQKRIELSRNFTASFEEIRRLVDPTVDEPFEIVIPPPAYQLNWFIVGSKRALLRFIFGDEPLAHIHWSDQVQVAADLQNEKWCRPRNTIGYQLCYDKAMHLLAIFHNGQRRQSTRQSRIRPTDTPGR